MLLAYSAEQGGGGGGSDVRLVECVCPYPSVGAPDYGGHVPVDMDAAHQRALPAHDNINHAHVAVIGRLTSTVHVVEAELDVLLAASWKPSMHANRHNRLHNR